MSDHLSVNSTTTNTTLLYIVANEINKYFGLECTRMADVNRLLEVTKGFYESHRHIDEEYILFGHILFIYLTATTFYISFSILYFSKYFINILHLLLHMCCWNNIVKFDKKQTD